ncbi:MAG: galactokinase [Armatimonadetes bacterium]|nr:galactokinase [Armatimonadota bacterium]
MFKEAAARFNERYGRPPEWIAHGPGRVNLIGEHTDYNDGFVFPAAIDYGVTVLAAAAPQSRLWSGVRGEGESFDADIVSPPLLNGWARYPAGVAAELRESGSLPNFDFLVESNLPTGSGLSSSAAIELAFATLWNGSAGLGLTNKELALLCQRAENVHVGLACGIMDQMASAMGREGAAMFLDTRSLEIQYASIPDGLKIVVCDTGKKRELTSSAYNERRAQCAEAARILGVRSLRDASLIGLESNKPKLDDVIYRRALHVLTENERCGAFRTALEQGEASLLGNLLAASHESLRNNYEVSCIELDNMVRAAKESPGCIGARMTGAGFGGACVALVEEQMVDGFVAQAQVRYQDSVPGLTPTFLVCQAANGAFCEKTGQTISNP